MKLCGESAYWWSGWIFYWLVETVSGTKIRETTEIPEPITSLVHRQMRQLSYPDDSEMGVFFALAIPLDDPVSTKAVSVAFFFEANYQLSFEDDETETETERRDHPDGESRTKRSRNSKRRAIDRRTIYSMIESKFESMGFPGRSCLLRSICETAHRHSSLHAHSGLIGDLIRIIFTPSSSVDESLPDDYTNAENQVDTSLHDCRTTYSLCPFGIYDYITAAEYE